MRGNATQEAAARRARVRKERVLIDGRLVSTSAPAHGIAWIYESYSCRCPECTEANCVRVRETRERRYNDRVEVDGRWVYLPGPHGSASTYLNRGCRCIPCSDANTEMSARRKASKRR